MRRHRSGDETRRLLLDVADSLFSTRGIHATGVDQIAGEAGVAPTTLYRLFGSKDGLIAAYVERVDEYGRSFVDAAAASAGTDARAQMVAVVAALAEDVRRAGYLGCGCMKTLAEYPEPAGAAHRNAVTAKTWVHRRFLAMATEYAAQSGRNIDTEALADELTLVFEGIHSTATALGGSGPARRARALAERIIDTAMERSG